MNDLRDSSGFEDAWRPPVRPRGRITEAVLGRMGNAPVSDTRGKLSRLAARAPEVMVKITGRTRGAGHVKAHLDYISRNGELDAEDRDGNLLAGRTDIRELAEYWSAVASTDSRRRTNTPTSLSIVLSMPAQTDPLALRDAARAFALETFEGRFDYVFVLH